MTSYDSYDWRLFPHVFSMCERRHVAAECSQPFTETCQNFHLVYALPIGKASFLQRSQRQADLTNPLELTHSFGLYPWIRHGYSMTGQCIHLGRCRHIAALFAVVLRCFIHDFMPLTGHFVVGNCHTREINLGKAESFEPWRNTPIQSREILEDMNIYIYTSTVSPWKLWLSSDEFIIPRGKPNSKTSPKNNPEITIDGWYQPW